MIITIKTKIPFVCMNRGFVYGSVNPYSLHAYLLQSTTRATMFIIRCATIVAILITLAGSLTQVSAGIVVENGFVKSATFQDGTTVYFYDGSFSQADTAITTFGSTLNSEAWWGDPTTASGYAAELKEFIESYNDLTNTINTPFDPPSGTFSNAADGFAYNPQYSFAHFAEAPFVVYKSVKYQGISTDLGPELGTGHWQTYDVGQDELSATNQNDDGWYHNMLFATATDFSADPNAVPEPSTAIAMGLLGIVGFAGNRRRRRQVSVA